ncbi:MAG: hypothetical protein RLZZ347_725 [Candidatus Parcubacteria bacterium]|jgi:hypothetical protein
MSFLSLFTRNRQEVDLILDIGSGSVGAALVVVGKDSVPSVVYTVRKDIGFQKRLDPKRLPILLTDALISLLSVVVKDGMKHLRFTQSGMGAIRDVHIHLASPWYVSHTKTITIKKEVPFEVTRQVLRSHIQEEQQALISSLPAHEGQFEEGIRPVEHSVIKLLLNGYETAVPFGKMAKELCLSVYVSLMPETIAQVIETAIYSTFHPRKIQFHSFGMSAFTSIRSLYPESNDFVFLDFGSEVSELFLVRRGAFADGVSVPCGKHSFVRMVAQDLAVDESVALSSIRLVTSKQADPSAQARMSSSFARIKEEWLAHLSVALDLLDKEVSLPETVYVTADADMLPLIAEYGKELSVASLGQQWHPMHRVVSVSDILPYVHFSVGITTDIFLGLEVLSVYHQGDALENA